MVVEGFFVCAAAPGAVEEAEGGEGGGIGNCEDSMIVSCDYDEDRSAYC